MAISEFPSGRPQHNKSTNNFLCISLPTFFASSPFPEAVLESSIWSLISQGFGYSGSELSSAFLPCHPRFSEILGDLPNREIFMYFLFDLIGYIYVYDVYVRVCSLLQPTDSSDSSIFLSLSMAMKRLLEVDPSRNQALKLGRLGRYFLDPQFLERNLEALIRKPVREEVEATLQKLLPEVLMPPINDLIIKADVECQYELHFKCMFPDTFFTHQTIEAENGNLEIVIRDAISKKTITDGPLSSKKVEIKVLKGDFDDQENWTKDKFDVSVVHPRKDKGPLLKGKLQIKLNNGVGYLEKLSFTDNSSWTRTKKFRLGARVNESSRSGQRIREGKSEVFSVKDQRSEANRKDRSLSLNDKVGRLKHIGEKCSGRLAAGGIKIVRDFLRWSDTNPKGLCKMMSESRSRMTEKKLKEIVKDTKSKMRPDDPDIYQESQLQYPSQGNGDSAMKILPNLRTSLPSQAFVPPISEMNNSAENLPSSHQIHVGYGGDSGLISLIDPPVPSNQFASSEVFEAAVDETLLRPNMSLPLQDDIETPVHFIDWPYS